MMFMVSGNKGQENQTALVRFNTTGSFRKSIGVCSTIKQVYCLISKISSILDRYPNLDFEINIVEICGKLMEISYSKVEHSKLYKSNSDNFCAVNSLNFF